MVNVRKEIYQSYVLKFKTHHLRRDERRINEYWSWCDFKFLPILETLDKKAPIMELGCGPGYLMEWLRNKGFDSVKGIDISKEQIQIAKSVDLVAEVADVFKYLSVKRETFSAIIAIDFIEHFSKEELFTLFPLLYKSLKQNGLLLLQTPNGQGLFPGHVIYGDLTHQTIFAEDSLRQILQMNGFDHISFKETGPVPNSLGNKINLTLWKMIRVIIRLVRQIEANNSSKLWTENMIAWCLKKDNK